MTRLYRHAHVTAEEFTYVQRRTRQRLGLRPQPRGAAQRLPEILTPEELQRILAHAYRARPTYGLIVRTLFETGLRVSELVHLEVMDIDVAERTVRVREGKGGRDRYALMTSDLAQQLQVHLGVRTRGALFESNRARPYSVRMIQHVVKQVAGNANVTKRIHPHTYRHSMATFLRNQGVPLDVVQLLLGHANPRTTQLYTRLSLDSARTEYDRAMAVLRVHMP
jgi:integrase/recombinase XerD